MQKIREWFPRCPLKEKEMKTALLTVLAGLLLTAAGCANAHDIGRPHHHHAHVAKAHRPAPSPVTHRAYTAQPQHVTRAISPRVVYIPQSRYYPSYYEPTPWYYYPGAVQLVVPIGGSGYLYLR